MITDTDIERRNEDHGTEVGTDEYLKETNQRKQFFQLADEPFDYRFYKVNYDGQVYVPQQVIVDRNNLLFDKWNIYKGPHEVCRSSWSVGVKVTMEVRILGTQRIIEQYGANKITIRTGQSEPSNDALEQSIKSAISDGMKKCSSWLGIASHVYRGDVKAISAGRKNNTATNPEYKYFIEKLGLNEYDFEHGLAVLPDSFKDFYEAKNWEGVFNSDVIGLRNENRNQNNSSNNISKRRFNQSQSHRKESKNENTEGLSRRQIELIKEISSEIRPGISDKEIAANINGRLALNITCIEAIKPDDFNKVFNYLKQEKKKAKAA